MHFLPTNVLPVDVVTVTREFWFSIDTTGEDRWILLLPINLASPLAICCVPVVPYESIVLVHGTQGQLTRLDAHVVAARVVICTYSQKPSVVAAVVDEPSRRLLG